MGKSITIDTDDLKVLLFATGAVKNIETAIKGFHADALAGEVRDDFTTVHDRLAKQWRQSQRDPEDEDPVLSEPLTPEEAYVLLTVDARMKKKSPEWTSIMGETDEHRALIRRLRRKLCLEAGAYKPAIEWGDSKSRTLTDEPDTFVRVTSRGYEMLEQYNNAQPGDQA